MTDVIIASSPQDARVVEEVQNHHAELTGALAQRVASLTSAISAGADGSAEQAELARWCENALVPHVRAERDVLTSLVTGDGSVLVESAARETEALVVQVRDLRGTTGVAAAVAAGGIQSLFAGHVSSLDEHLLPVLAAAADVSVADAFAARTEILEPAAPEATAQADGHSCNCGEHDDAEYPELDARAIPHAIRHATIFGALEGVRPGAGMVLVAPHDPIPLLGQIDARWPGAFRTSYLQRGPEDWRLLFVRG